jgi:hypothetical protein
MGASQVSAFPSGFLEKINISKEAELHLTLIKNIKTL